MNDANKIVLDVSCAEITEKKSRFIAACLPVSGEDEALSLIALERKRYYDARHTCFAYVCGENNEIARFSDDGEPHGTAGKPILDVIEGNRLKNALITVTRYFGGILLGTGGLVRAYSGAASLAVKEGISAGTILETSRAAKVEITIEYKDCKKLEHLCRIKDIQIENKEFACDVTFTLLVREELLPSLEEECTDLTNGSLLYLAGPLREYILNPRGN